MMGSMMRRGSFGTSLPITTNLLFVVDPANYSGSGSTIPDSFGVFPGTLTNGASWSSANGGTVTTDGTDDFVSVPLSGTYTSFTVSVWAKRTASWNAYAGIVFSRGFAPNICGLMCSPTANRIGYTWQNAANTYSYDPGASLNIAINTWYMISLVVSPTSASLYLNTTKATNSVSHIAGSIGANGSTLDVGRDSFGPSRYVQGVFGPVFAYDRALSDAEISENLAVYQGRFA